MKFVGFRCMCQANPLYPCYNYYMQLCGLLRCYKLFLSNVCHTDYIQGILCVNL